MNVREFEGVHIGHLLSRAITTGQITPHFQAIVDNTQKAVKYECLCRFSPDFELGDSAKYPLWKILENGKHNPQLLQ
jgi:EAL domain-containing protein (putative c-di-GMP-specific phosphodiesterase class I)